MLGSFGNTQVVKLVLKKFDVFGMHMYVSCSKVIELLGTQTHF